MADPREALRRLLDLLDRHKSGMLNGNMQCFYVDRSEVDAARAALAAPDEGRPPTKVMKFLYDRHRHYAMASVEGKADGWGLGYLEAIRDVLDVAEAAPASPERSREARSPYVDGWWRAMEQARFAVADVLGEVKHGPHEAEVRRHLEAAKRRIANVTIYFPAASPEPRPEPEPVVFLQGRDTPEVREIIAAAVNMLAASPEPEGERGAIDDRSGPGADMQPPASPPSPAPREIRSCPTPGCEFPEHDLSAHPCGKMLDAPSPAPRLTRERVAETLRQGAEAAKAGAHYRRNGEDPSPAPEAAHAICHWCAGTGRHVGLECLNCHGRGVVRAPAPSSPAPGKGEP